ncbi:MAG: glycosyl transferase [Deltaproteobacteria bacterium]|nr:glycosyl transferase [Deltaproteobacteria bacterium]
MSNFYQEGSITTFHDLYRTWDEKEYLRKLESKLERHAGQVKISLLLPCLYSELKNADVLDRIVGEINKVKYLRNIVIALGGANEEEFKDAQKYFKKLKNERRDVKIVWVDGPRVQEIFNQIKERDIPTGVQGKGQSVWITLGYLFARGDSDVVTLHDCDIVTYDRTFLARLIEPVANPHNDFEFCKGFYARISPTERAMKGRVTRLFITPFVDSMIKIMNDRGHSELERFFRYHRTFKYPLAGEFTFSAKLARGVNIAYDWGIEVATLSEVYHRALNRKIAQVDLAPNYEHKHQALSPEDADSGLHRMVVDIAKFYLNYMRSHGIPLDDAFVDMVLHTYFENALRYIKFYSDDAEINNLVFDRHEEEISVRHFRGFLWTAWEQSRGPTESTLIPSWNRVIYSLPDIYSNLHEVVEKDNEL